MDVRLRTFPSNDREFGTFAREAWDALPEPQTREGLQRAIRVRYPAAVVTAQTELARHGEGPEIWYAFRAPRLAASETEEGPAEAFAILDDERRFIEVTPALAAIAEIPARVMIGRHVEDFSNPADPTIREDIALLWAEFVRRGSIASTVRFNFADGRPRELAYRLEADADGPGRHRLTVRVLPDPA